jgi:hypothetical protein
LQNTCGERKRERDADDLRHCFERFLGIVGTDDLGVSNKVVKRAGLDWLTLIYGGYDEV